MAALTTTTFAHALKRLYTKEKVQNLSLKAGDSPFYAMVKKSTKFGGANLTIPVLHADIAGRSKTFATAQSNKAASAGKAFLLTRVKDYALASFETEVVLASRGDEAAFLRAAQQEMDSAIRACSRSIAIGLYRDSYGSIGTISAISSSVITLTVLDNVTNFYVGQKLVFADTTTSGLRDSGTAATVTVVDRDLGKVTISATPTGTVAGDLIFTEGDHAAAGSTQYAISGLADWIPATAPALGSDSFFGVDRGADVTRLSGHRIDGSAYGTLAEAIFAASVRAAREGGAPDTVLVGFEKFESLVNSLGSKLQYTSTEVAGIGFEGVKVHGPKGVLKVYPDMCCPSNVAYVLTLDTWCLHSLGPAPQILDHDGNRMLREASADALEVRIGFFGNLGCNAPGRNALVHTI